MNMEPTNLPDDKAGQTDQVATCSKHAANLVNVPVPNTWDAVSISLPTVGETHDYENGAIQLTSGYPRFVEPLAVQVLNRRILREHYGREKAESMACITFPNDSIRTQALLYACKKAPEASSLLKVATAESGACSIIWDSKDNKQYQFAKKFWQHAGEIISSRHAAALCRSPHNDTPALQTFGTARFSKTYESLQGELAACYQAMQPENVYLSPSGMASIFLAHNIVTALEPSRSKKIVQFGFPYTDTKMINQEFGAGLEFFPQVNEDAYVAVENLLNENQVAAIFTEFPSNPLLESYDLNRLSILARKHSVPLVIDDTIATPLNVDLSGVADIYVSSLTKFATGSADVIAGMLALNPLSPLHEQLIPLAEQHFQDTCFVPDLERIAERLSGFEDRMSRINANALQMAQALANHPAIERVYYPGLEQDGHYEDFRTQNQGYSGLLSFVVKEPEQYTASFFDGMRINKGPSLGTDFTMACMYTLLAHYNELDEVAQFGVDKNLIRMTVGIEDFEDLKARVFAGARNVT